MGKMSNRKKVEKERARHRTIPIVKEKMSMKETCDKKSKHVHHVLEIESLIKPKKKRGGRLLKGRT